ncbi:MAG: hypothetical protein Q9165_003649 [Trypethelium subeluteriae]
MSLNRPQVVIIDTFSDGDSSHVPNSTLHWKADATLYLEKIAALWMHHRGEAVTGVRYILNRLPEGYTLWAKRRSNSEKIIDKWLFGHPSHKFFDSPNRFFPHFLHLMEHGTNAGCPCTVCGAKGSKIPPMGGNQLSDIPILGAKSRGRPPTKEPPPPLDAEGTPDIYRSLINKLQRDGQIDVAIEEHMSLDWRVENEHLQEMLEKLPGQPSWLPRLGELVLFVRHLDKHDIIQRHPSGVFRIFQQDKNQWDGLPLWEAGVITQTAQEDLQIEELIRQSDKDYQVNYAGFRVEPTSDPNSKDKPFSRQYKYVPLHHIRPLAFCIEALYGTPQEEIHETVENAKTLASSLTLLGKHRFRGTWPSSDIFCKGLYLGSELIVVGDTVRLLPTLDTAKVTDILKVTAIKLNFSELHQASRDDQSDGHPYNSRVIVAGKAYTMDVKKASPGAQPVRPSFGLIPPGTHNFGKWYPMHPGDQSMQVTFNSILGRCYDSEALQLWFSSSEPNTDDIIKQSMELSSGLQGTLEARSHARKHNKRLSREGRKWLWADTRAEALDVESLNGIETSKYDEDRNPRRWVRYIKELDGIAGPEDKAALERDAEKRKRPIGGLASQSSFVQSALAPISGTTSDEVDEGAEEEDDVIERASKRSRSSVVERGKRSINAPQLRGEVVELDDEETDSVIGVQEGEDDEGSDELDDVMILDKFRS